MATRGASVGYSDARGRGILLVCGSALVFTGYNAVGKWLVATYDPLQIVFFRGLFGLLPLALIAWSSGGGWATLRSRRPGLQVSRGLCGLAANACFILAYRSMPLADAVAIGYAAPIFVTALSVPLLSERVGAHRWSAVAVGFLGVLMIARPGVGVFDWGAALAVLGTLSYALTILATRRLAGSDATACTMLYSTGLYAIVCSLALPAVWVTPSRQDLALFVALGALGGLGMFLFVHGYRFAPAATLAPFDYTAMGWASLFGFAVWGDVPAWLTLAGIAVIVASSLYITHREARLSVPAAAGPRQNATAPDAGAPGAAWAARPPPVGRAALGWPKPTRPRTGPR